MKTTVLKLDIDLMNQWIILKIDEDLFSKETLEYIKPLMELVGKRLVEDMLTIKME